MPDLNPIERLWRLIKDKWLSDFVTKGKLLWALERPQQVQTTCTIKTRF